MSVEGDDETITGILTNHLKRELRALEDVDIVGYDDDWWYALRAFYVEHETDGGVKAGMLSIAYIRENRLSKLWFKDAFQDIKAVEPGRLGVIPKGLAHPGQDTTSQVQNDLFRKK